jgi:NAD(P)-dependent dehydrogenase (short-subunit alcohol dehydrogenase family)
MSASRSSRTSARVALVTGASSGIGHLAALELAEHGFTVYAAARRTDRMSDLSDRGIRTLALDVTDEASAAAAVTRILEEQGRIDLLVNNAGYGSYGAVEDVPLAEGRRQFDVNLFGAVALIQRVLPAMRAQRSGRIMNVTSVGGKICTPFGAWYHGSKFALEGMSDALRLELAPHGIDVVVIEPGAVRTEWGSIAAEGLFETSGAGAYADQVAAQSGWLVSDRGSDPSVIAATIVKAATARHPRTRYASGAGARAVLIARRLLPDRVFDALVLRALRA